MPWYIPLLLIFLNSSNWIPSYFKIILSWSWSFIDESWIAVCKTNSSSAFDSSLEILVMGISLLALISESLKSLSLRELMPETSILQRYLKSCYSSCKIKYKIFFVDNRFI